MSDFTGDPEDFMCEHEWEWIIDEETGRRFGKHCNKCGLTHGF